MEGFQFIKPSPHLAPYVKQYWFLKSNCIGHIQGIIPTGYISLFFHRANTLLSLTKKETQPQAYISGQTTSYTNLLLTGYTDIICIDFLPYGAKMFFDIPLIDLKGQSIALDLLGDTEISELEKRLADTSNDNFCVALIENFLTKRLSSIKNYNLKRITATITAINKGETDISKLAETSCLSYKQFKRIFAEHIGANPKDFLRIIRFQKGLYTLQIRPQINFTELSFECGYYDQPHLIKEFKSFSSYTPSEYIDICAPYSDYFT